MKFFQWIKTVFQRSRNLEFDFSRLCIYDQTISDSVVQQYNYAVYDGYQGTMKEWIELGNPQQIETPQDNYPVLTEVVEDYPKHWDMKTHFN